MEKGRMSIYVYARTLHSHSFSFDSFASAWFCFLACVCNALHSWQPMILFAKLNTVGPLTKELPGAEKICVYSNEASLPDISVNSPRKVFLFIIIKNIYGMKVSKKIDLILKKALLVYRGTRGSRRSVRCPNELLKESLSSVDNISHFGGR